MILFNQAEKIVLQEKENLGVEKVNFHNSIGRILAEDIFSDVNFPPFDKSAMDGFAIKYENINDELEIIETIAAGQAPQKQLQKGQASKIMTGAPIPLGADFVIQVEKAEISGNKVRFKEKSKNNIITKASELKKGDQVLKKGDQIDARHIAVLASVGKTEVLVYKQAIVGIISTGDEIVEPEIQPKEAQIRNSNGHQLIGQILQCGAIPEYFGIVKDTYKSIKNVIKKSIKNCDVIIITGGVSMGDFDYVPQILEELGVVIKFDKIAVKPGKPTTYGTINNKYIFGLPGNPVSSFIQFELLAKPLIFQLMNHSYKAKTSNLELAENYSRNKTDRQAHLPVQIINNKVYLSKYKGSAHIHALSASDGLIEIEKGKANLQKGAYINVRLF